MQIVIELTDEQWKCVQDGTWCGTKEILNGTPLPKGHGRLIDADAFSGDMFCDADLTNQHTCYDSICKLLYDAQTIIEADGGDEE